MTFYARLSGYLMYRTHDHLDAAIQRLICGAWLNTDEQWLLKGHPRQVRAESTIDHERNILVIPPGVYQNLGRITTELFAGATDGLAVTSSSDNCFDAWVETPLLDAADIPPATAAPSPRFSASTSNRLRSRTASASNGSAIPATNGGSATYSTPSTLSTTPMSTKSSNPLPHRPSDTQKPVTVHLHDQPASHPSQL